MKKIVGWTIGAAGFIAVLVFVFLVLFEDPHVAQGRVTYKHYCAGCHGIKGDGYGFNSEFLDPYPRDLSDRAEPYMSEGTNDEIFSAIATGVSGFAPPMEGLEKHVHAHNGGDEGDSEGGHDMEMMGEGDHDMEKSDEGHHDDGEGDHGHDMEMGQEGQHDDGEGDRGHDMEMAGESGHDMEMDMDMEDDDEAMGSPLMPYWGFTLSDQQIWELVAYIRTLHKHDQPPVDFEQEYKSQRRRPSFNKEIIFPSLDSHEAHLLIAKGEKLFNDQYACTACHEVHGEGGKIGPPLDRAGERLNPRWVYKWIQDPELIKRGTAMPAFGLPDEEAKAITLYITTLQAEGR